MSTAGKNIKMCVTCAYYNGNRIPHSGSFVEYDSSEKGMCYRISRQGLEKNPMWCCGNWEIWPPLNK